MLRNLGFKVQCYPVLGHGCSVCTGLGTMLEHMGVQASARNRLVSKLAASAVTYAHACQAQVGSRDEEWCPAC